MKSDFFVNAFSELGSWMKIAVSGNESGPQVDGQTISDAIRQAGFANGWFDEKSVLQALEAWSNSLIPEKLTTWLEPYQHKFPVTNSRTTGLILAGNIPMVGLHDVLTTLVSGHKLLIKCSSDDAVLIPFFLNALAARFPELSARFSLVSGVLPKADAYIATGSDNSARYFEYYFRGKPFLIRKNRSSVAVLDGSESSDDLWSLGKDIFSYYGLGCRNVSKLLVPDNYSFEKFFEAIVPYGTVMSNHKYANNYDYNRAIFLLDGVSFLDNNFLLLRENPGWSSPVSVLNFQRYNSPSHLSSLLAGASEKIQCTVGVSDSLENKIAFGMAQSPDLWDYADGVDTLDFLSSF